MKICGFRSIVAKKDQTRYVELYLLSDRPEPNVVGSRCEVLFLREDMIMNVELLAVDSNAQIFYNRFGRPESVVLSI